MDLPAPVRPLAPLRCVHLSLPIPEDGLKIDSALPHTMDIRSRALLYHGLIEDDCMHACSDLIAEIRLSVYHETAPKT
ncbi:hypothetical protein CDEST_15578 [Colletotrichum destructivum]|uniref:Uncharacterized protein n=1 Tax=Colletotrichum destructivum TaxID=34406 RepID=A0AAX4J4Q2_9PEZI|nr:hypothetical protein CDEST_15578 [Colletotrichum destructivum]